MVSNHHDLVAPEGGSTEDRPGGEDGGLGHKFGRVGSILGEAMEVQQTGGSGQRGLFSRMVQRWGHPHVTKVTTSGVDQCFPHFNKFRSIWRAVKTQVVGIANPKYHAICNQLFSGSTTRGLHWPFSSGWSKANSELENFQST